MNPIETILDNQCVAVLDGAMATELETRGCDLNDEFWSEQDNRADRVRPFVAGSIGP